MPLSDAALVIAATAFKNAVTHMQLHSGPRGAAGTTNAVGSRVAVSGGAVDADGDVTWSNVAFTGLAANQAIAEASYWDAATAGTFLGGGATTGDTTANSSGAYTLTSVTENFASA